MVGATYAEREGTVDLLFLEEAGQVAVANSRPLHGFPDDSSGAPTRPVPPHFGDDRRNPTKAMERC